MPPKNIQNAKASIYRIRDFFLKEVSIRGEIQELGALSKRRFVSNGASTY
jgi:hypothetical protein